jgi:iron complex outermembrane receptor protein
VELSVDARPFTGLTITSWVAWNDAKLTESFPVGSLLRGFDGDQLPYSARWTGSVSVDQEFPLANGMSGLVGAALRYVDDRKSVFVSAPQRQDFPSFVQTDLRVGVKYESWSVNVFVNNVADKRGILSGGVGSFMPNAFVYIQPRTIGASLSKSF